MGLSLDYIRFIEEAIEQRTGSDGAPLRMLELGDQTIDEPGLPEKTGKAYFEAREFEHTSVDLNGMNGALVLDLTKPEQFTQFTDQFDVVTNSGTTEHVEPLEKQYESFLIIHQCLKVGGVAVHIVPDAVSHDEKGKWRGHCPFYYTAEFFDMLAAENGYVTLENTVMNELRAAAFLKVEDRPFMEDRARLTEAVEVRTGGNSYGYVGKKSPGAKVVRRIKKSAKRISRSLFPSA